MTSVQMRQLTRLLFGVTAVLAVLYLLLLAGFGRGVPSGGGGEAEAVSAVQLSETQVDLPGLNVYDDLVERPLFAEDRRPVPKEPAEEETPVPEAPPTAPLNVALTGIIHTPQTRIALVRDNSTGRSLNLSERMPLPGDQGGWLVKTIEPRRVVFEDTGTQTETTIELAIGAGKTVPAAPPPPSNRSRGRITPPDNRNATAPEEDAVAKRAAEIRRRIEERRAQLRREAQQNSKE